MTTIIQLSKLLKLGIFLETLLFRLERKNQQLSQQFYQQAVSAKAVNLAFNVQEAGISVGVIGTSGKLIGKAVSDKNGDISLDFTETLTAGGSLLMTFTGFNKIPLTKKVRVRKFL